MERSGGEQFLHVLTATSPFLPRDVEDRQPHSFGTHQTALSNRPLFIASSLRQQLTSLNSSAVQPPESNRLAAFFLGS